MRSFFATLLLFVFLPGLLSGQNSRGDLEQKRKQLLVEINENNKLLEEVKKNQAAQLDRFFALQSQIQKRRQLVTTLEEEIRFTDTAITRVNDVVAALRSDIGRLQEEYARMLRIAYRHRLSGDFLTFLFSARSVNDAFRRWQYLRQYNKYRTRQAHLIIETQSTLRGKALQLEERRREKEGLLLSARQQQELLKGELNAMDELINALKKNESRISAELRQQQRSHQELNAAIENVIREEMARKRREARQPDALKKADPEPEGVLSALSADFAQNKGRLPWPVSQGVITRFFGTQAHPTSKSIEIVNNGIDIHTDGNMEVKAVFQGTVVGARFIPGYKNMIILQHGQYYTVYSNLDEVLVNRGDQVTAGQPLGKMNREAPDLHFEIWREKQKLNPVHWISDRK